MYLPSSQSDLSLLGRSRWANRVIALAPVEVRLCGAERAVEHQIGGVLRRVAQPVTFTPFASVRPCTARCVFCSETLIHRDATTLSASLRPGAGYWEGLERALRELRGLLMGVSLSGLEATDDADWLAGVIGSLQAHEAQGGIFGERVLYSNGSGLSPKTSGERLIPLLQGLSLTRVELSRHSPDPAANDAIMRFKSGVVVRDLPAFEETVRGLVGRLPVRLVCVLQRGGVSSPEGVEGYLRWAASLGVRDVVFRELSRLGDLYRPNATTRAVAAGRVGLEELLDALGPRGLPPHLEPLSVVAGYYYWNLRCRWRGEVEVTFETSDYAEMKARHASDVLHKLIFHADGRLCADWDPGSRILLDTRR